MKFKAMSHVCSVLTAANLRGSRNENKKDREFPGGLVVKTQCFHCCGPDSIPGLETEIKLLYPTAKDVNMKSKTKRILEKRVIFLLIKLE